MTTKKIKYFLTLITLLLLTSNQVLANTNNNIVDFSKTGTVSITLKENLEQNPIVGAEITIVEIAEATTENNNLAFIYHKNITDCKADLSNLKNENLVNEISKCITNIELPSQTKLTDQTGVVVFDELRLGLYLVKQTNKVEGYSNIDEFLVMIPKVENNSWIYNIEAKPKTDITRIMDLTVEKVWNDSSKLENHPQNVTIELYKGNKLIDTIDLNEDNNWTYTWKDIEKSDEYSIKEINIPAGYTANYRQEENKFIVTNTKTLVQTGTNILTIELLATLGLLFLLIGIICEKRKKYE